MSAFIIINRILLLTIAGAAVMMDLKNMKIQNSWILCTLLAGFGIRLLEGGAGVLDFVLGAAIPLLAVGWLYLFRMLGPGDIKLFCVLGGIMGLTGILKCIWFSFFLGAVISAAILVSCGGFRERLQYLKDYLEELARTGKIKPYSKKGTAFENIHFTVPIFLSVMLYTGGMY